MNDAHPRRSLSPRFSLLNLLTLTAVVAIGAAAGSAYRENQALVQQHDELLALSSRLRVGDAGKLNSAAMPRVADDFYSWNVHVPDGQDYELRLGVGEVSENGVPRDFDRVAIPAGRHRVTLHAGDSPDEEFRFVVYLDGEPVIDRSMGRDWIPGGWSSAGGVNWPQTREPAPEPLQLSSRYYKPKRDFGRGSGRYFNGNSDNYVTRRGYRLWIDDPDRSYPPASPFVGIGGASQIDGVGLRDGMRFQPRGRGPFEWWFTRPSLETRDPVLQVSATFIGTDGATLTSQTPAFESWQLRSGPQGENALSWQDDPPRSARSAFLHAVLAAGAAPQPVVELRWDTSRPDEVALRLADTPANDAISRWRLRFVGGAEQLWRVLQVGDRTIDAANAPGDESTTPAGDTLAVDLGGGEGADTRLRWRAKETLPLQIVERTQPSYGGMGLFQGLPVTFGMQVPAALKPALKVQLLDEDPNFPGQPFPSGAVYDEIEIDLDATVREWIWLRAEPMEAPEAEETGR